MLHKEFDPRRNSLNAIRLGLAGMVLVAHSWPLGGFGRTPAFHGVDPGQFAVAGFFTISGFLITGSRLKLGLGMFLWRRFLRIYPGFWVALAVVGLVLAPLQGGSLRDGAGYVSTNATTYIQQYAIPGTLDGAAFAPAGTAPWNGSLWTLVYEVVCYLGLAALFSIPCLRRPAVVVALFLASMPAAATADVWLQQPVLNPMPKLGLMFLAGAVLQMCAHRMSMRLPIFGLAVAAVVSAMVLERFQWLAPIPLAYALLWLSTRLPLAGWGRRNDYSYGVYIYAFPAQQLLFQAGAHRLGVFGFILASAVCVAPFAVASWWAVERPAIRLGRTPGGRKRARTVPERRAVVAGGGTSRTQADPSHLAVMERS